MKLTGRTVLITRNAAQEFRQSLERQGARVLEVATIAIQPRRDQSIRDAIARLAHYQWVVLTSGNAVEVFLNLLGKDQLEQWRTDSSLARICAVGPATAKALRQRGLEVDLVPEVFQAEGVVAAFRGRYPDGLNRLRILFPAAAGARRVIPEQLEQSGAEVDFVPIYDTVRPVEAQPALHEALAQNPDIVAFTSSSTVHNLVSMAGDTFDLQGFRYAAIGPVTAKTADQYGLKVVVIPSHSTLIALATAIAAYLSPGCDGE